MNITIKKTALAVLVIYSGLQASSLPWPLGSATGLNKYPDILAGIGASYCAELPFALSGALLNAPEPVMDAISVQRAKRAFWEALKAPAYEDFVHNHCNGLPQDFVNVPIMDKYNYIRQYPLAQTLKGGIIPAHGFMDPSSGTSGRRTLWVRGQDEIRNAQKTMDLVRKVFLDDKDYVVINMFLPSAWSLGLMRGLGPNVEEAIETMKDLGTSPSYLITGHTSIISHFIENAPFDLRDYDITFLIGGEHMPRRMQHYIKQEGIGKVYAGYGASDIHFTVGIQDESLQQLQELAWAQPELKEELTGSENGLPYFFQYSPLTDYIEVINDRLIFTDLDHTRVSPRIRYDLGDRGKIIKMSHVQTVLSAFGIKLEFKTNLPLICLYGRAEHAVIYHGAELAFDDLELAVRKIPHLGPYTNRCAYNQFADEEGRKYLELWVELKKGISADRFDRERLELTVIGTLCRVNPIFNRTIKTITTARLSLKMYEYGESPMNEDTPLRKAVYTYNVQPD